jgi:cytosine/adenosine deaminase-related metal-dependent hydrolase
MACARAKQRVPKLKFASRFNLYRYIVVGPVTAYSASTELLQGAAAIRREHKLLGHVHLLETRAQALMAKQFLPSGSAVKHLHDAGFLQIPGTSCAHCVWWGCTSLIQSWACESAWFQPLILKCDFLVSKFALSNSTCTATVWLTEEEQDLMAAAGATAVHNPYSNLRLGSGVAPIAEYAARGGGLYKLENPVGPHSLKAPGLFQPSSLCRSENVVSIFCFFKCSLYRLQPGVNVCLGADGACSSDGQDILAGLGCTAVASIQLPRSP